jgi:hypothetical protein
MRSGARLKRRCDRAEDGIAVAIVYMAIQGDLARML